MAQNGRGQAFFRVRASESVPSSQNRGIFKSAGWGWSSTLDSGGRPVPWLPFGNLMSHLANRKWAESCEPLRCHAPSRPRTSSLDKSLGLSPGRTSPCNSLDCLNMYRHIRLSRLEGRGMQGQPRHRPESTFHFGPPHQASPMREVHVGDPRDCSFHLTAWMVWMGGFELGRGCFTSPHGILVVQVSNIERIASSGAELHRSLAKFNAAAVHCGQCYVVLSSDGRDRSARQHGCFWFPFFLAFPKQDHLLQGP